MQYRIPQQVYPEDPRLNQSGDDRPNTGLREGNIPHSEVNDTIRTCAKTVIFGQQTRLRNGELLPDQKLPRFHAGHDLVKFFYSAVRQLPPYLIDALLENNVSVTLVQGPSLLVFHDSREHQSFHMGRTRRTLYIPEKILREAADKGYDYWAISEVLIQESLPLLNYILLLETIRRIQEHLKIHLTIGYYIIADTLRRFNHHLVDNEEKDEDEFRIFFRYYADALYSLKPSDLKRDPYLIVDDMIDEKRERFWAQLKLHDICDVYRYPTYCAVDRDICHGAAFRLAREISLPLEPETIDDVMHDLWDEGRFKLSRSVKTEELLEQLIRIGADGITAFVAVVAEEIVGGYAYVTANRMDGFNIAAGFKRMLQSYSTTRRADLPGCLGFHFKALTEYFMEQKRYEFFEHFKEMEPRAQEENLVEIRQLLYRVIEVRLRPSQAPDFKRRVELADSARVLIDTGEGLLRKPEEKQATIAICGLLAKLDRHPLYHTLLLEQFRELSGNDAVVLKEHLAPEIERLAEYLPSPLHDYSADPHGVTSRYRKFEEVRRFDPNSAELLELLAALFVRLDRAENYDELVEQTRALGEYAVPALQEVVENTDLFGDNLRGGIRDQCKELLDELSAREPTAQAN